jgi:hypothetical protein
METNTTPTPAAPPAAAPPGGAPPPGAAAQPRRRGRPFGSRSHAAPLNETPIVEGASPDVEPQKRKRRSKAIDKDALAKQLIGVHMIGAKVTGLPFVAIDAQEAAMLADAIENVAREYDLALDGKTGAFIQLIAASAVVYGPRVMQFQALKRQAIREARARAEAAAHVAPIPSAPTELNGAGSAS